MAIAHTHTHQIAIIFRRGCRPYQPVLSASAFPWQAYHSNRQDIHSADCRRPTETQPKICVSAKEHGFHCFSPGHLMLTIFSLLFSWWCGVLHGFSPAGDNLAKHEINIFNMKCTTSDKAMTWPNSSRLSVAV